MNPYESPEAKLEPPIKLAAHKLNWVAIVRAGAICVVTEVISMIILRFGVSLPSAAFVLTCILTPWILGAAFLGWTAKYRWVAHAMIYSVIPSLAIVALASFASGIGNLDLGLLVSLSILWLSSAALTLSAAGATRLLLNRMQAQ